MYEPQINYLAVLVATFGLTDVIFEKLYGINMSFQLLGLMIVGAILAVWV